ncbi:puromycin-sensitive aminopeptidase-like [Limulus polyphemus]|uniref:Puromycin-sensitive aminopeptidase-like n=1 Tax=Limulus polyphemus TaxID=6850 RepID=A0ABM1TB66_LIMPO|nr:puromycin-sensitive aminopeptidase-like [Limulus polyphemus]
MPDSTSVSKPFERLPTSVLPIHYNINFKPDLQKLVFEGHETIKIEVKNETSVVVLNVLELQVKLARFTREGGLEQNATNIKVSQDDERLILTFDQPLTVGKGELYLEFCGVLNEKMKGFYRSKYTTLEGEVRYAAVTQFEPTDARRAFPCWDEPALKATFDISLIAAKDLVTLSNMNIVSSKPVATNPELKEVQFATSPVMSTYLVAVVVGEFDYVEEQSGDGVQVRVYTPVGKQEQGRFALEVACKALPFYKQYFNIAYPLPKMDLIAISDFSAGAMENWGLVTYRETCLLVDPQNTSADRKQWIALVVGHELAHQWFGNLVTMEWWTHLWLNEGFASFIEFLCVNHLFPEYEIWTQFVTDVYTRALELDALHNSHPIEVPVGHPSEIDEIFDDISYNKGASVIRMLHRFLGDEVFSKGMNTYLTRHMYKNAQTEDLWQALEDASQKPVAAIMSSWTKQKGFPVVSVSCRQDGKNKILSLTQEKFCADGNAEGDNLRWLVPINITTAKSPEQIVKQVLLEAPSMEILIENVEPNEWVKHQLYREADLHEEKDRISRALGAVQDEASIRRVLEFAISDEVRSQDTVFVIISAAMTKAGRELAWQFFKEKKDELQKRYEGGFLISRLVKYVTENFATEEKAQEIGEFFSKNPFPGTERTIQQSLETIRLNEKWLSRDADAIKTYLTSRQ